ncbi:hypothetical protein NL676_039767 [Syzygium grande]|nr:hypothetical protein NL676_039767 [Syzygium grande]
MSLLRVERIRFGGSKGGARFKHRAHDSDEPKRAFVTHLRRLGLLPQRRKEFSIFLSPCSSKKKNPTGYLSPVVGVGRPLILLKWTV